MTLNKYQNLASTTDRDSPIDYYYHGLASETGELSAVRKRVLRGDDECGDLIGEISDVLWYVAAIARHEGYTLDEIAQYNLDKLADRFNRGVIRGQGDDR